MIKNKNNKLRTSPLLRGVGGVLIIFLFSLHLQATIYTVKQDGSGDFTSIQEAIDSPLVLAMDTILVYPGVYYENLLFNKKCWLGSLYMTTGQEEYKHNTIIDGNHNGSVIRITQAGANVREINGFTIQNGKNDEGDGGGIYLNNASKTKIINCIIRNNECEEGGGLYLSNSENSLIRNCYFCNNRSNYGSAIYINSADETEVINVIAVENYAAQGTICNSSSQNVYLNNVSVHHNYAFFASGFRIAGYDNPTWIFDSINRCSSYMNFGGYGADFYIGTTNSPPMDVYFDTLTVLKPDHSFAYFWDYEGNSQPITLDILNGYITPVNANLYVNPVVGNDTNNGLSVETPLQTLAYAYKLIASDSVNPKTIFLASGLYSSSISNEIFPFPTRPNVNVIGDSINPPVFDLENQPNFMGLPHYANNISIKNLIIKNADPILYAYDPIVSFYHSSSFTLENIKLVNCKTQYRRGIEINSATNFIVNNCEFNFLEGFAFEISVGGIVYSKAAKLSNLKITNCTPVNDNGILSGWPITISGPYGEYEDNYELSNLQITQNTSAYDTDFPVPGKSAMLIADNVNVKISNATIADNGFTGPYNGTVGALVLDDAANVELYNSILYGDTLDEVVLQWGPPPQPQLDIAYSDIEGGEEGINVYSGVLNYLEGNLDTIPYFNDTSAYPYQLRWDSPLIDKGTPMYSEGMEPPYIKTVNGKYCLIGVYGDSIWLPSTDLAGRPRIKGGRIDMGAYEYQDTTSRIRNYYRKEAENFLVKTYPNPFKHRLYIDYRQKEKIKGLALFIYDAKGYEVCSLQEKGSVLANIGRLTWDGKDQWGEEMPPGTYFLYAIAGGRKIFAEKVVKK